MHELVVVSGKGGTGKTSITACFAILAGNSVVADCDVDAADLHLVLTPSIQKRELFRSGNQASIRQAACQQCGACFDICRYEAVFKGDEQSYWIDPLLCEGCGVCVHFCPAGAIDFPQRVSGEWFRSETRCGPMVHAQLEVAAENSGRLVSIVREQARRTAAHAGRDLILVDGPPGIGCPVIASITGASAVLAVTEPTLSGEHDLRRILELTRHFDIPTAVCVNKWDLNPDNTAKIEALSVDQGVFFAGRISYDNTFNAAQFEARTVVETGGPAAQDIQELWQFIRSQFLN